jgi:hypothetical protein
MVKMQAKLVDDHGVKVLLPDCMLQDFEKLILPLISMFSSVVRINNSLSKQKRAGFDKSFFEWAFSITMRTVKI